MNARPVLDVSTLQSGATGPRAALWWGTMGMIVIESTVFALCIASYFYLRMCYAEWPPPGVAEPSLPIPTINLAVLLISFIPHYKIDAAAETKDPKSMERLLIIASLLGLLACALRIWDFRALNTGWQDHSYGSIVWAIVFLHSIHLYASTFETILMAVYVSEAPLDEKHRLDLNVNAIYWFFIVISWTVIYAVIWGGGRVL
jgi:heme/copper-type cytochrome/quinol oxidase subunit 3